MGCTDNNGEVMSKNRSSIKAWLFAASGLTAVIGGLAYYKYSEITTAIAIAESFPEHYEVVETAYVERAEYVPTVSVLGNTVSPLQTELFTELSGKVSHVGSMAGQRVQSGDLLFQLDISEEQARIRSAKAREQHARSVYTRSTKLLKTNAISQEQHDQAYADLIVIQSEIDVLETTIEKKSVYAPFTGMVGMHNVKVGDYVSANEMLTSFVGITEYNWIEFSVPQFYPRLSVGDQVEVRHIDAFGQATYQIADVIARDVRVSDMSRSLKYRAQISREQVDYAPNTPMEVQIPVSSDANVYRVPVAAVNQDLYGAYVVSLSEEGEGSGAFRANRRPVEVIAEREGAKFILNGIEEGERIAAAGAFKLYDGLLVRTKDPEQSDPVSIVAKVGE